MPLRASGFFVCARPRRRVRAHCRDEAQVALSWRRVCEFRAASEPYLRPAERPGATGYAEIGRYGGANTYN